MARDELSLKQEQIAGHLLESAVTRYLDLRQEATATPPSEAPGPLFMPVLGVLLLGQPEPDEERTDEAVLAALLRFLDPPKKQAKKYVKEKLEKILTNQALKLFDTFREEEGKLQQEAAKELVTHRLERVTTDAERREEALEEIRKHAAEVVPTMLETALLDTMRRALAEITTPRPPTLQERREEARRAMLRRRRRLQRRADLRRKRSAEMHIVCRVATVNKMTLQMLLQTEDIEDAEVAVKFQIYDYDPHAGEYYMSLHTGDGELVGTLTDEYEIGEKPTGEPERPLNYELDFTFAPTEEAQDIHRAHARDLKAVLQWRKSEQ